MARALGQRGPSGRRAAGGSTIRAGRWRPEFACSPAELREARQAPGPPFRPPSPPGPRPPAPPPGWRPRVDAVRYAADPHRGRRRRGRAPPACGFPAASSSSTSTPVPLRPRRRSPPQAVRLAGRRRCHPPRSPPALPRRAARPLPLLAASRAARAPPPPPPPEARARDGRGLRRPKPSWAPAARVTPPLRPPQHLPRPPTLRPFLGFSALPGPSPASGPGPQSSSAAFPSLPPVPPSSLPPTPSPSTPALSPSPSQSGLIIRFLFLSPLHSPAVSLPASRCPLSLSPSLRPPLFTFTLSLSLSLPLSVLDTTADLISRYPFPP